MEPKIYRPIKSDWFVQGFGKNLACARTSEGKVVWPYRILPNVYPGTCPINSVKLYPLLGLKGHNGYDLACWRGEPVYHSGDFPGWMKTEVDNQGGIGVDIVSNEPLKECTEGCPQGTKHYIKLRYWHLEKVIGFDAKPIKMGDLIGLGDSTGISGGDHVHFGPKWCDKEGTGIHNDNGFYGAFDPGEHWENVFVLQVLQVKVQALSAMDLVRKVLFEVVRFLQQQLLNRK